MTRQDNTPRPPSGVEPEASIDDAESTPRVGRAPTEGRGPTARGGAAPVAWSVATQAPIEEETEVTDPAEDAPRRAAGAPAPPPDDPRVGTTLLSRYRLDGLAGKGGMGRVYRATQLPLNRSVAVKILKPEFQRKDPQFVRRFFLEAATAARLNHPHTITVFDYGESETGELFIAMEYLNGRTLSQVIAEEGVFDTVRVLHVAQQMCRALREAHANGIIHRDLKPGNILLVQEGDDRDFVKVLDFGLVKLFNAEAEQGRRAASEGGWSGFAGPGSADPLTPAPVDEDLTKAGMFLGSPKYMSPEQIQGISLDPRTDVYSLGVLMYHMVAGQPPFTGGTSVEVIYRHVNDPPPPLGPEVPPELQAIILRCLAKRRDDRYPSMKALLVHLQDARRLLVPDLAPVDDADIELSDLTNSFLTRSRGPSVPAAAIEHPFLPEPVADPTGAEVDPAAASTVRARRWVAWAPWTAALAFLGVTAVAVAMVGRREPPPIGEAPVPTAQPAVVEPVPSTARVTFESVPPGAAVSEGARMIGRTPFVVRLARGHMRTFTFALDGHRSASEQVVVQGEEVRVRVPLEAIPRPRKAPARRSPPPPPNRRPPHPGAYKDNPY